MVADAANHWYADAAKNLYVYLADLDVQKCRQIKTKVIIAIFKNKRNYSAPHPKNLIDLT